MLTKVVLPAPLAPMMPIFSPSATVTVTSLAATTEPKALLRRFTSSSAVMAPPPGAHGPAGARVAGPPPAERRLRGGPPGPSRPEGLPAPARGGDVSTPLVY